MVETELPKILYKYRDWMNSFHRRNLTESELYFAAAEEFNDPFDCSIPFRYDEKDLTPENLFQKYLIMAEKLHPDWSTQKLHELAFDAQRHDLLHDTNHLEKHNEDRKKKFNRLFGIVSLTTEKNNFLMWSHYSNSHSGFVIGYNSQILFEETQGQLGPVQYQHDFPKFGLFGNHIEYFIKYAYTKSKIWEYENEYRLLKDHGAKKILTLTEKAIEEIILGNKMDQKTKFEIIKLIEQKYPKALVFDCKLHSSQFELVLERIR